MSRAIMSRTIIGPLKSTFTPPPACSILVAQCATCTVAWQGQSCYSVDSSDEGAEDQASCWPPATATTPPAPLAGWGFYSPGLNCPVGYTSACTAISQAQGSSSSVSLITPFVFQYSLNAGETAVGCCPTGYSCSNNPQYSWQTCVSIATSATYSAVTCESGTSGGFAFWTIPFTTVSAVTISEVSLYAPMIQINWKASDRPVKTVTVGSTSASTSATSAAASTSAAATAGGSSSGLTTGAKIAIGVVVPLVFLIGLGLALLMLRKMRRNRTVSGSGGVHYSGVPAEQAHELQGSHSGGMATGVKLNPGPPQELFQHHGPVYELGSPVRPDSPNKPAATTYQ
ncbi:uncharacterized protein K441DRAFT_703601 [Cenococcum geophilum 1.58]|uniref:uncharacterized protein n=1 Tax=Cenococcum geophilum 1.58 TaxID=794803 RepID=UPI00358E86CB|nr:hypothetical protein K441DRAFT_703601 [Cenococcum geophilum 1.58]